MGEKRGSQSSDATGRPSSKRQKHNEYNGSRSASSHDGHAYGPQRSKEGKVQRKDNSSEHRSSKPVATHAYTRDPQSLLKQLLEQIVDSDAASTPADADVLHHAKQLHRLLSHHRPTAVSLALSDLAVKAPETVPYVTIPPYSASQPINPTTTLPALPPITESYLEEAVFRHQSKAHPNSDGQEPLTYERLEFLGDAYIEIISTRLIYSRFPHLTAGQQAQLRESLVKNETLALYSQAYGFGDRIVHGGSEDKSKIWTKILADVFEAYVAVIILSDPAAGFQKAEMWLTELWAPKLLSGAQKPIVHAGAKQEIARLVLAKGVKVEYRMERNMEIERGTGKQKFWIGCYLTGWGHQDKWLGSGEGQNKVQAGALAAADALVRSKDVLEDAHKKKLEAYPKPKEE